MGESIAMRVIQQYKTHFIVDPYLYATGQLVLNLPSFTTNDLQSLCYQAQTTFTSSQIILHLSSPIVIVGDLHGQILDLFRIIREFGMPDNTSYLFLGDIVDRGEFSVETATIIFALRVMYPDNVHIIRGNHEFAKLCSRCGFLEEVLEFYGSPTVFNAFVDAFAFMPLVALVDDDIVCVHGGIGPQWFSINQVSKIPRPIDDFDEDIISAMTWGDPSDKVSDYDVSPRGMGHLFGMNALNEFLDLNSRNLLVRGHECVQEGCCFLFNNRVATVFSASNYCGLVNNDSAVLIIKPDHQREVKTFSPLQYLKRNSAVITKVIDPHEEKRRKKDIASTSASIIQTIKGPSSSIKPVMMHPSVSSGLNILMSPKITKTDPHQEKLRGSASGFSKIKLANISAQKRPSIISGTYNPMD